VRRRFFVDQFEGESATLRGDTANHLARVLRAEPGQLYELSDGANLWLARIDQIGLVSRGENRVEFSLVEQLDVPSPGIQLTLLLSLVKFDRFEWALEKATELSVTEIIPLAAERTDKALVSAAEKRHGRWEKILHESAQQSRRLAPPKLAEAIRPAKAFASANDGFRLMLSERSDAPSLRSVLAEPHPPNAARATLAIGPEGGWTDAEIESARAAHFSEASLGDLILRTETAVVAALAVVTFTLDAK
jgi:16S rRNA (uracil1498-N3)-methyltransferase